jgi:beta-lactamase class C
MLRVWCFNFSFIFCLIFNLQIVATSITQPTVQLVKRQVQRFMRKHKIPGMAVVLYVHHTPYIFHFGYANREKKIPVTRDTLFEIGSISKVFTCILIAQEILAERMQLHDPISDHIAMLKNNQRLRNMTIEKLCTHTALLPYNAPLGITSKASLINHMVKWRPATNQAVYRYSNHGIELLRIALEESTNKTINRLFSERILGPLNMSAIGVIVPDNYKIYYAKCYDKAGNLTTYWDRERPLLLGSGGLRTTSVDMLNFLQATIGLPNTPTELYRAIKLTQTPHVKIGDLKHGLGWAMDSLNAKKIGGLTGRLSEKIALPQRVFSGHYLFDKTGTTNGFQAYIGVVPDQKIGIVLMANKRLPNGWKVIKQFGKELLRQASK